MKGHGSKFAHKKEAAIIALLTCRTIDEAARSIDIGSQTLFRWLKLPEFQTAYQEARRAAMSQCFARLQQASGMAATLLARIIMDNNAPVPSRVRAADRILVHARQSLEAEDLGLRVTVLEKATKLLIPSGEA